MTEYTMALAKRDLQIGYLLKWSIQKPMDLDAEGWNVYLTASGNASGFLVDHRTRKPREFATADGAIAALRKIGFNVEYFSAEV